MPDNSKKNKDKRDFQVYGKYSLGSGSILFDSDRLFSSIDNPEVIESYKKSISKDFDKAGIGKNLLKDCTVLDVGTGRQAIAFYKLGAKKIKHYDLSPENVKRMNRYIESNSLQNKITTECVDLVKYAPPKNHFDLVFLHGIVQHFSDVGLGLKHCLEAVKEGGYVSLYFYRSGTFLNFVVYLIRDLINKVADPKEYFINSSLIYSDDCLPDLFVSNMMDDF
jgi:SAM-dependent methyltransferase